MAAGAWIVLWDIADLVAAGALDLVGALVGALVAGFVVDLPTVTAFLGVAPAFFFAGLTPDPPLAFVLVVSRETSGRVDPIKKPQS